MEIAKLEIPSIYSTNKAKSEYIYSLIEEVEYSNSKKFNKKIDELLLYFQDLKLKKLSILDLKCLLFFCKRMQYRNDSSNKNINILLKELKERS